MARISYDGQTAAAFKAAREVPRDGLSEWREPFGNLKLDRIELIRWFPETARTAGTFPSVKETCQAFAAAGFHQDALEQVRETNPASLADFLGPVGHFPPGRYHDAQSH